MNAPTLDALKRKLSPEEPSAGELRRASVAIVVKDADDPNVLLIKRADRSGDPWSGQVAFPGGKEQAGDGSLRGTAVRETREEVGIDLDEQADFLGYFSPFRTHTGTLDVFPAVFLLRGDAHVNPNAEVSSYRWVALGHLVDERSKTKRLVGADRQKEEAPALRVGDYLVWGLTHRVITSLLS